MELELKNECKKIARIRNIPRDVILRAGIEKFFSARADRRDALILQPKIPPRLVVILRLDLSGKNFPPPLIDQQTEWKKRDLLESLIEEQADIPRSVRRFTE